MSQKKKKSKLVIILIIQLVVILLLALVVGIILIQRNKKNHNNQKQEEEISQEIEDIVPQEEIKELSLDEGAYEAVKSFLSLYHACDPGASQYVSGLDTMEFPAIQAAIADSMTFTLGEARLEKEENGFDYAVVEVTIETVSFAKAYEDALEELEEDADSQEILDKVEEKLEEYRNSERETFEIEVLVFDFLDTREIQMTSDLSDALTGGLITYMAESMEGGESNE